MVKASSGAASQLTKTPSVITESAESTRPKASACPGRMRPDGTGREAVRAHDRVDVGVVPHVERAGRAGADGDGEDGDDGDEWIERDGGGNHADKGRENDERHHPRLQQLEVIACRRLGEAGIVEYGLFQKGHANVQQSYGSGPCVNASVWPDAAG